jgi:hypothetical protein
MTWLAWRQFRTQALVAIGALALLALVLIPTGVHLRHLYDLTVAPCTNGTSRVDCSTAIGAFNAHYGSLQGWLEFLILVVPAVVGLFWGAPLVARELETGTYRLAWTQSVTRTRWLVVKLTVVGVGAMAVSGLLSLAVTWWFSPFDRLARYQFGTFDQRDIVAIGYAALAFAVGVTAGVLIRRTLPAMAVTLVVFVTARLSFASWIRPNLLAARHLATRLDAQSMSFFSSNGGPLQLEPGRPNLPGAWVLSTRIVDAGGHTLSPTVAAHACPRLGIGLPPPPPEAANGSVKAAAPVPGDIRQGLVSCVTKLSAHYHELVTYQPASRYWTFQWMEAAIFLAVAVALAGFCLWWVRRRLT